MVWQAAQWVAVALSLTQIWTPGMLGAIVQRRTSCSMHGQLLLAVFRRQTHSRGGPCRQPMPADNAQAGMLFWHSRVPVQATPTQCSRAWVTEAIGPSVVSLVSPGCCSALHWTRGEGEGYGAG